jgi:hypothetical protein
LDIDWRWRRSCVYVSSRYSSMLVIRGVNSRQTAPQSYLHPVRNKTEAWEESIAVAMDKVQSKHLTYRLDNRPLLAGRSCLLTLQPGPQIDWRFELTQISGTVGSYCYQRPIAFCRDCGKDIKKYYFQVQCERATEKTTALWIRAEQRHLSEGFKNKRSVLKANRTGPGGLLNESLQRQGPPETVGGAPTPVRDERDLDMDSQRANHQAKREQPSGDPPFPWRLRQRPGGKWWLAESDFDQQGPDRNVILLRNLAFQ